jgi:hypothetical protein
MLAGLSDSNEHADLDVINDAVAKQDSNSFVYNSIPNPTTAGC